MDWNGKKPVSRQKKYDADHIKINLNTYFYHKF